MGTLYNGGNIPVDTYFDAWFEPIKYTIKFHGNGAMSGGAASTMNDQILTYGESAELSLNEFLKENASFLGWATTPDGEVVYQNGHVVTNLTAEPNGVVNLYAVWEQDAYTVTLDVEGQKTTLTVAANAAVIFPNEPSKTGFDFVGWYYADGTKYTDQPITKNITLTARFEIKKFTVTFLVDGHEYTTQRVQIDTAATLPEEPTKGGYGFIGWYFMEDLTQYTDQPITADTVLIAQFEKKHTVTLIVDGAVYTILTVIDNTPAIIADEPTKEDYIFAGWYLPDGTYYVNQPITEDTTLTAKFETKGRTVICIVDGEVYATLNVPTSQSAALPTNPTKEGFTFAGWYLSDGTRYTDQPVTEDLTLTAQFEVKQCTVSFMVDGRVYKKYTCEYGTIFSEVLAAQIDEKFYRTESEYSQSFIVTDDMEVNLISTELGKVIPDEQTYTYVKYGVIALAGILVVGVVVALGCKGKRRR